MNCLVCNTPLQHQEYEYGLDVPDLLAAPCCEINYWADEHSIWTCPVCHSLHIYCNQCTKFAQLIARSTRMDDIDNEEYIVAWRETDGSYHSTSLSKVLEKKCGLKIPIVNYKAVPLLAKHMQVPIKKAERIYAEMFDYIVNDFGDNHNFDLSDLDLYCLNPNDLRLIHPDELKLTKEVGKGFNILERSWAEWKCSCGKIARIDGHDD